MGKIRLKTIGDESLEEQEKKKHKEKREQKKLAKAPGLKGGERVVAVGPSEEELATIEDTEKPTETQSSARPVKSPTPSVAARKSRSKSYLSASLKIDKNKAYTPSEALDILLKLKRAKFDETVELHINTTEKGISRTLALPHAAGRTTRVKVADDALLAEIEGGKIDFDVLVASPEMMPKLAKVAKILGPRGLMPNPKNGTISDKPQELVKKFEQGQTTIKTESKVPVIHTAVGKISSGPADLLENLEAIITALKKENIKNAVIKSTMSPGLKLQL